ncbi:outer membrane beta-barrel protein [Paracoccus benzoatiresistens]|uniref:Outer membrane beta-barrel protein n=1 Tax=Paracoccus benzoatiresistens TaxID=2997341 RepID=A0ABT4J9U6_9RHOB|nr:outer membrane beta-barrel protein [Paracoccus sp. EF6]MCZ0963854.1 outer membrane beta-barrel protein [Paracoccus sp. EF6]
MFAERLTRIVGSSLLLALSCGAAFAQDGDWSYGITAYGWFNDTGITTDTPQGEVDAELSFSDALDNLDFAFMGAVEARNGPWGVMSDLLYFKLSAEASTPRRLLFSDAQIESEITVLSAYATYRAYETANMAFDVGAGVRGFWIDLDTTLVGAAAPTQTINQDKNWVDPLIAARFRMDFNEKTFGTLFLDAGGTGDSRSWQALATVGYRLNEQWEFQGGYRYLEATWDTDFGESSMDFSGPILGATYRF